MLKIWDWIIIHANGSHVTAFGLTLCVIILTVTMVHFELPGKAGRSDAGTPALDDGEEGLTVAANVSSAIGEFEPGATYKVRCGAPFYLRVGKGWPAATSSDMWMSRIDWHHIRLGPSDTTLAFLSHEATKCEVHPADLEPTPYCPTTTSKPWKDGSQMASDGTLIAPWVAAGTPRTVEPVLTCYPPSYLWGARAERIPEGMSGVASEPMSSGWHRLSFTLWAKGDIEKAARWYSKLIAVGTLEAQLDERLDLEPPPTCEAETTTPGWREARLNSEAPWTNAPQHSEKLQ